MISPIIPTRIHGLLDYVVSVLLLFLPQLGHFAGDGLAAKVPVIVGVSGIAYSLLTRYEWGVFRVLPFKFHLGLDLVSGLALAGGPWALGFAERVWVPHLVFGLIAIVVSLISVPHAPSSLAAEPGRG